MVEQGGSTQESKKSPQLVATGITAENATSTNVIPGLAANKPIIPLEMAEKTTEQPASTLDELQITTQQQQQQQPLEEANTGNDRVSLDIPRKPLETVPKASILPAEFSMPSKTCAKNNTTANPNPGTSIGGIDEPKVAKNTASTETKSVTATTVPTSALPSKPFTAAPASTSNNLKAVGTPSISSATAASPAVAVVAMDEESLLEEKLKLERKPLTDKYGSFIIPSDTCLQDARSRLHIALEQTRQLREAFTDRVYGKYRVCLVPPSSTEQLLTRILTDPTHASKDLDHQITVLNEEKAVEKKEASKLNAEVLAAGPSLATANGDQPQTSTANAPSTLNPLEIMNAENAEQLMYISAGLSLIVLPEQDATGLDMSRYADRSPVHPITGQRVKGISAAAAAAGDVMLDRARKGAAMREERNRVKKMGIDSQNYSRLEFLANNPITPPLIVPAPSPSPAPSAVQNSPSSTAGPLKGTVAANVASLTKKAPPALTTGITFSETIAPLAGQVSGKSKSDNFAGAKRPLSKMPTSQSTSTSIPSAAAKAIRARVQATMSVQTLLSLSPSGEELRTDGKLSAATLALMERGVGTQGQNTKANQHQRYRHPFPESQGGRGRALQAQTKVSDHFLNSTLMTLSLPPLPTAKERRSRKRLSNILTEPVAATTQAARSAIKQVLKQFVVPTGLEGPPRKCPRVSEISFLHQIHEFCGDQKRDPTKEPTEIKQVAAESPPKGATLDPFLAFHVMQAVGLIQLSSSTDKVLLEEKIFPDTLDTSMFAVAEKRAMGDEGGVSRRSIGRLRKMHEKFKSNVHTFSGSLFLPLSPRSESVSQLTQAVNSPKLMQIAELDTPGQLSTSHENPPVLVLRGGGEALNDNSDNDSKNVPLDNSPGEIPQSANDHAGISVDSTNTQSSPSKPVSHGQQAPTHQPHMWNDPSRLVLMNTGFTSGHQSSLMQHSNGSTNVTRLSGHFPGVEHYHPNTIQLANQLRLSRMTNPSHHGANELAEYIGGLHPQSASPYDWTAVGAASAAAAASAQSLAALGIAPHRSSLVHFPLQDRARALLRDQSAASVAAHAAVAHHHQQALAYLSAGYPPGSSPHFPHIGRAMLSSPTAFIGQSGMASVPTQAQIPPRPTDQATTADPPLSISKEADDNGNIADTPMQTTRTPLEKTSEKVINKSVDCANSTDEGKCESSVKRKLSIEELTQGQQEKRSKKNDSAPNRSLHQIDGEKDDTGRNVADNVGSNEGCTPVKPECKEEGTKLSPCDETSPVFPGTATEQGLKLADSSTESGSKGTNRLHFFVPPAPPELRTDIASLVLQARSHDAVELADNLALSVKSSLVAYFIAVGAAVPIPKALVTNLLKEKFNSPPLKSTPLSSIPQSSRDAAAATILLWMWKHHEPCFQRAFAKSGRIDVEPECKWLMSAATEKSARSLLQALEDTTSRSSSPLAIALMAFKSKSPVFPKANQESDRVVTATLDLLIVSTISKGLTAGFKINENVDAFLPNLNDLLDYLDESRKSALYSKSQERALLAALISRKATMSLSFSHAYVSSLVRAGEALGHGELFEVVQNEEVNASTMIPYDVFTDETGAWEDPCRPLNGFTANLTGDDLMRQAHARAMIQKSLKKLQDRHNIKGGTQISGAYTDPPTSDPTKAPSGSSGTSTPKASLKRRSSFSEPQVQSGTGSAAATSWALYDPKHYSVPLSWNPEAVENTPYGKHNSGNRPRSLSLAQYTLKLPSRGRGKHVRSASVASSEQAQEEETEPADGGSMKRSTREIPWADVAGIFQNVALPGTPKQVDVSIAARGRTIFAPFVRKVAFDEVQGKSDDESDEGEDLREESVLERHQIVLDRMKEHLSTFLEARQKTQEKRKNRSSKT